MDMYEEFNKTLIEISRIDGKIGVNNFIHFINENFVPHKSTEKIDEINANIEMVKNMARNDIILMKARLKQLEEDHDPSKFFPALIGIFGIILMLYSTLNDYFKASGFATLIAVFIVVIFLVKLFNNIVSNRNTIIFFNTLFNSLDFKNNEKP
ncbi:hypothetical protein LAV73_09285 [Lysinibacillus xylanilyticus]|uniref:hypothetical protein n=1 Tax=Lysinibacillus xylanilyticus TaxID=582475 RepID=UPI002B24326A|nr:hypothetical protein [Lysinibacillus xylanilyticus]MEB2280186.1 hypothetical protein [Lysinibacillus xylanilyticus]